MRAAMGGDATVPSPNQASQAVQVVLHGGKRHNVVVTSAQADNGATTTVSPTADARESRWTKTQTIWTAIGAIVAVIGAYPAYRQWRG
jgi:hypothetical protein